MSGAEALIAVSVAGNVVQFVDFASRLCSRMREYSSGPGMPSKLAAQADRLSDLVNVLESIANQSSQQPLTGAVLVRCQSQAQELSDLLDSLKGDGQGPLRNARKAIRSLNRSEKITELQGVLDSLMNTLNLQLQVETRHMTRQLEINTVSIIERQLEQTTLLNDIQHFRTMKGQVNENRELVDKPLWMVPVGRNPGFVGRTEVLAKLEAKLSKIPDAAPTAVLCGLGGVGKSQIALEHAYRGRKRSPRLAVLWIHASTPARFVESYKRIAAECRIPGSEDPQSDMLQIVRDWLELQYQCDWLMIVDNVDDRNMLFATDIYSGKALQEYIPQCHKGAILYTTRNRDIGMDLSYDRRPIFVPAMDVEEAQILLGEQIRNASTDDEQLQLLEELVYLPLAISQAAAFMAKRRKSVSEYLELYRKSESMRVKLLGQRFNHHGRETRPLESVVTTWWISFNHIKSENPRAADILSVMSFLDNQGIPFSLLVADNEDTFDFEEAMGLLEAFSLVTVDIQRYACNVHRLVAVAIQGWLLEYENRYDVIGAQVLELIANRFPNGSYDAWPTCRIYYPHAEAILRHGLVKRQDSVWHARASLLLKTSTYLRTQGRFEASEPGAEESMRIFQRYYGNEHADTLCSIANYAHTVHKRGRYQQAAALQMQVLKTREKVLGTNHRATLDSLNALGSEMRTLGLFQDAEEIHRRELSAKEQLLAQCANDRGVQAEVLIAMNNVASVLSLQGKHVEAEHLHRKVLERCVDVLGMNHPDSFITRGQLAGTVRDQGRLSEAEEMYNALLRDRSAALGESHPDTLITLSNIGTVKARQGKRKQAEDTYLEVLRIQRQTLGETHPSTINISHNLACSAFDRDDFQEAETGFRNCLALRVVALGDAHPHTILTQRNLAACLQRQGKYEDAKVLELQTLELCDTLEIERGLEKVQILENLAQSSQDRECWEESEQFRHRELQQRLTIDGDDNDDTMNCLDSLAYVLGRQAKHGELVPVYQHLLAYKSAKSGWQDEQTLQTLWNLALTYRELSCFDMAEEKYEKLVALLSERFGPNAPRTLDSVMQLAWVLQQQEKYPEAEEAYRRYLKVRLSDLGTEDPIILVAMENLALVLKGQDHSSKESATPLRQVRETKGTRHDLSKRFLPTSVDHLDFRRKEKPDKANLQLNG